MDDALMGEGGDGGGGGMGWVVLCCVARGGGREGEGGRGGERQALGSALYGPGLCDYGFRMREWDSWDRAGE